MILLKNQIHCLEISHQAKRGDGLAYLNKYPIYVPNTLPGDVVQVKLIKIEKKCAYARVLQIKKASIDRVKPACFVAKTCGGCQIQHQALHAQHQFKEKQIRQQLSPLIKGNKNPFKSMIPAKQELGFRNRMQFAFAQKNNQLEIGLYAARSHRVVDTPHCFLMSDTMNGLLKSLRDWYQKNPIPIFDESTGDGILRYLMIRYSYQTKQMMVVVTGSEWSQKESLIGVLKEVPQLASLFYSIQDNRFSDAILGEKQIHLWGKKYIEERVFGLSCQLSPASFMQTNSFMLENLYKHVLKGLNTHLGSFSRIIDLYCGTGILSLILAKQLRDQSDFVDQKSLVIGVDREEQAIADAKENAKQNNILVEFICESAESYLKHNDCSKDYMIIDPPRKGCHPDVLEALALAKPSFICMLSCNLDTLRRDLAFLQTAGYEIEAIQGVDMFPHSAHGEMIVFLKGHS